ncbi:MAG TPA: hypothetical protein VGD55_07840 [Acidothermaceae bacterium]
MVKRALAWAGGLVLLALVVASVPLTRAAHQSSTASDVGVLVAFATFGGVGVVVAVRQPRNVMGWILIGIPVCLVLNTDMSAYAAIDYRVHPGRLPVGPLAVQLQPSWAPAVVLLGLAILLFPDATLPSIWWRRSVIAFLTLSAVWMVGAFGIATDTILLHKIVVDASGNLTTINHPAGDWAWWGVVQDVFFPVLAVSSVAAIARQVATYRSSTGERRLQFKWGMAGATMFVIGVVPLLTVSSSASATWRLISALAPIAVACLPLTIGVAILKYRLYDIDRLISRTLSYALITGLLLGVYVGIVVLTTDVLSFSSPIAVAASTLAAAALFSPVRTRVQRLVDRRFNRVRYDAVATVAAFSARLREAVDLDAVRADLLEVVGRAVEPAHAAIWINHGSVS